MLGTLLLRLTKPWTCLRRGTDLCRLRLKCKRLVGPGNTDGGMADKLKRLDSAPAVCSPRHSAGCTHSKPKARLKTHRQRPASGGFWQLVGQIGSVK